MNRMRLPLVPGWTSILVPCVSSKEFKNLEKRRTNYMSTLQQLKDDMAKDLYGTTVEESTKKGLCIQCGEEALPKCYSDAGRREFKISGLCEKCFDEMFQE